MENQIIYAMNLTKEQFVEIREIFEIHKEKVKHLKMMTDGDSEEDLAPEEIETNPELRVSNVIKATVRLIRMPCRESPKASLS